MPDATIAPGADASLTRVQHAFHQHTCSERYSCAIDAQGLLYCWGLVPPFAHLAATPLLVTTNTGRLHWSDWEQVEAGSRDICALRAGGQLYCWGDHSLLAQSSQDAAAYPQRIRDWRDVRDVAVSDGTVCAVLATGELHCWGSHAYGELGVGDAPLELCGAFPCAQAPRRVGEQQDWTRVSGDRYTFCGVRAGRIFCWGSSGENGQPSVRTGESCQGPLQSAPLGCMRTPQPFFAEHDDWVDVDVRQDVACARRQQGQIACSPLAPDVPDPLLAPEQLAEYEQLSSTSRLSCGVNDRALWCWGYPSDSGQLGDGRDRSSLEDDCFWDGCAPVQVTHPFGEPWLSVRACVDHVCGMDASKNLFCWGSNEYAQLGLGARDVPGEEPCGTGTCARSPLALGPVEVCTADSLSGACTRF